MIAYLKGKIISLNASTVTIFSNGIGWEVNVGFSTFQLNDETELFIHTQMKENDISLWGFRTSDELKLFKILLGISGVGGKTAQALISVKGINGIYSAVSTENPNTLKIPGIGAKTAEKIIFELKGKVKNIANLATNVSDSSGAPKFTGKLQNEDEAKEALTSLGYKINDIEEAIDSIRSDKLDFDTSESLIKELLKRL